MMKFSKVGALILFLTFGSALADTPPPGTVKIKDTAGNSIDATAGALNVNVTASSATQAVTGTVSVSNLPGTQPVSAVALPLPAGAATAANQSTANTSLSSIDSKVPAKGQTNMAGSAPVTIASDQSAIPVTGSITANNSSVGANNATGPVSSTQIGGQDGSGKLQSAVVTATGALKTDSSAVTQPVSGTVAVSNFPGTQPVSAAALPLPAGAATESTLSTLNSKVTAVNTGAVVVSSSALPSGAATAANQATANSSLSSIDGKTPALGQAASAASAPVVIASDQSPIAITGSITASNPSVGTNGSAIPASSTQIGAKDGSGNLAALLVNGSGALKTDASATTQPVSGTVTANAGSGTFAVSAAALPLPSGAATAAKQPALGTAGTASADVLSVQGVASMTALKVDGSAVTQPVSAASLPLPAGAATAANQATANTSLSSIDSKVPANLTVTSTRLLVDGSGVTQPVSGTVTSNAGTGTFTVDGSGHTQPVSAAALPLPAGASTAAKQPALGAAGTASTDVLTVQGIASMTALKVDGSATTQPVSASALPLPTGASTAANQTTGNSSLASIDGKLGSLGQKSMAGSAPVVIASDQSAIPITGSITASNASIGTNGAAGPASSTQIAAQDGSGNLTALLVNGAGSLKTDSSATTQPVSGTVTANAGTGTFAVSAAALPLPSGAATAANQSTANTSLSSIDGKVPANLTVTSTRLLVDGSGVTQPVSASSLPLPTGAATAANQSTANTSLSSIDGKFGSLGQKAMAGSAPVVIASDQSAIPISGSVTATNPSVSTNGAAAPGSSTQVGAIDGSGNIAALLVNGAGALQTDSSGTTQPVSGTVTANAGSGTFTVDGSGHTQPVSAAALPLPSGASTSAKQPALGTAGSASADVITVQGVASMTALKVDGSAVTQPVSASSLPLPTGAATESTLSSLNAKVTAVNTGAVVVSSSALPSGAATAANQSTANTSLASIDGKVPANLTVTSTRLLVDGSGVTQPVSGTVTATNPSVGTNGAAGPASSTQVGAVDGSGNLAALLVNGSGALKTDASATTQPVSGTVTANAGSGTFAVSAAALPLPSGASTAAKQPALGTAGSASADVITVQGVASMTALKVDGSAVTQPVSASSLPLPTGAATESTLSTLNGKVPSNLTVTSTRLLVDGSGVTQPVSGTVTANAGSGTFTVSGATSQTGTGASDHARLSYSSTNVTTSAYVQLLASTSNAINAIEVFDSSGQTLVLAIGAAASEIDQIYVIPGGNGRIPLSIASGTRISLKAVTGTANTGEIDVNFYK